MFASADRVLPPIRDDEPPPKSPASPASSALSPTRLVRAPPLLAADRPWDDASEAYIRTVRATCARNAQRCRDAALWARKMHSYFAIPTVVIPILMTPVSSIDECEMPWVRHVNTVVFIVLSLLNSLHTYWDYSKKSERCMGSAHKYTELCAELDLELTKVPSQRVNVNLLTAKLRQSVSALDKTNWWVMAARERRRGAPEEVQGTPVVPSS